MTPPPAERKMNAPNLARKPRSAQNALLLSPPPHLLPSLTDFSKLSPCPVWHRSMPFHMLFAGLQCPLLGLQSKPRLPDSSNGTSSAEPIQNFLSLHTHYTTYTSHTHLPIPQLHTVTNTAHIPQTPHMYIPHMHTTHAAQTYTYIIHITHK